MRGTRRTLAIDAPIMVLVTVGVVLLVLFLAEQVTSPNGAQAIDIRPWILLVSLVGFNCITYVVWANRWNIIAHTALAFSVIAYVIPIVFLHRLDGLSSEALDFYYQVMAAGLLAAVLGILVGGALSRLFRVDRLIERANFSNPGVQAIVRKRVLTIGTICALGVFAAFALMGFVPAFTSDPLTAKFFRGAYAASYQPVAPLYRGATSIVSVLLPVLFLLALKLRSLRALGVALMSVAALLLGLIRDPAASGLLLLIGVYVAVRRKPWTPYFALLVGVYFAGGAMYYVLTLFGLDSYSSVTSAGSNLIAQVAAGAPDINDQLLFLSAWLQRPEFTHGATWIGGLVPGNFPWNSSVWSLRVVNPSQEIATIASGGLRLPAPIWGFVSFGWIGVIVVSFGTGMVQGLLAGVAKRVLPSTSIEVTLYWLVLYAALVDVLPNFFRFSYLTVLQLVVVFMIFRWRTGGSQDSKRAERDRKRRSRISGSRVRRQLSSAAQPLRRKPG